jgi:NAD(P)-dependent dehydrogenase (short-subunit alcohol dehydrogenase family)
VWGSKRTDLTLESGGRCTSAALDAEDGEAVKSQVAAHQFVRPDEIANAVAFLASTEACYISGQDLIIDFGLVAAVRA